MIPIKNGGMILKVMKTIISMLFKQSCVGGEKCFLNRKVFRFERNLNIFLKSWIP